MNRAQTLLLAGTFLLATAPLHAAAPAKGVKPSESVTIIQGRAWVKPMALSSASLKRAIHKTPSRQMSPKLILMPSINPISR